MSRMISMAILLPSNNKNQVKVLHVGSKAKVKERFMEIRDLSDYISNYLHLRPSDSKTLERSRR